MPIKEDTLSGNEIKRLIWHEYTHAVVYDLCNNHCPIWFNEGLAKWEEAKQVPVDLRPLKTALKNNELIPLNELGSYFTMDADVDKLNLAYLEAYSFIEFIVKEWDLFRLRKILREFKKEKSAGKAFARVLYRSMEKMNSEWLEFLRKKYK